MVSTNPARPEKNRNKDATGGVRTLDSFVPRLEGQHLSQEGARIALNFPTELVTQDLYQVFLTMSYVFTSQGTAATLRHIYPVMIARYKYSFRAWTDDRRGIFFSVLEPCP